jgi:hypothetical protein
MFPPLANKKECLRPTLFGWICILLTMFVAGLGYFEGVQGFLAVNRPISAKILVVDGQYPGYGYDSIAALIRTRLYEYVLTTGVDVDYTYISKENFNIAAWSYKVLLTKDLYDCRLRKVPAGRVQRDRTYTSALAVKEWMKQNGIKQDINIVTFGVHSRRSWILYKKVFKGYSRVGVISLHDLSYDNKKWFNDSRGVRQVMSETIGYLYTRIFFHPGIGTTTNKQ